MNLNNNISNQQAEIEILGRIIRDPQLIYKVSDQISSDDFNGQKNKLIFEAMKACSKVGKPIEPGILLGFLEGTEITLLQLMEISSGVASTSDIRHYSEIVLENSRKRRLSKKLQESITELGCGSYTDISQGILQEIYMIAEVNKLSNYVNRRELMEKVLDFIQEGIDTKGENVGMKTGWKSLDTALTGFKKGDMVIIGARPSMGKTAFALNLADKLSSKHKVLFFELEMTDLKLGLRELAAKSYTPLNKLYEPHTLTEAEHEAIIKAVSRIEEKGNLTIDDKARATLDHIRNQIRYKKISEGVDVVIVDHIGLIKMSKGFANRNDWMGEVSSSLKAIAKEFNVCVIALSQLSRGVESRTGNRPMLSDLRDSGNIEQDADAVLFLYRGGYYSKTDIPDTEPLEIIIAKNRDGRTGPVNMAINLKKQLVTEIYR